MSLPSTNSFDPYAFEALKTRYQQLEERCNALVKKNDAQLVEIQNLTCNFADMKTRRNQLRAALDKVKKAVESI